MTDLLKGNTTNQQLQNKGEFDTDQYLPWSNTLIQAKIWEWDRQQTSNADYSHVLSQCVTICQKSVWIHLHILHTLMDLRKQLGNSKEKERKEEKKI